MSFDRLENEKDEGATIKSARRVLQILELFRQEDRPLSTTDVAQALGYPISSTAALLKSLLSMGYLLFDPRDRTYVASVRLGLLGCPARHWGAKVAAATRMLAGFSETVGMAVALGVRNGNHIQYIQRFDPPGGQVDYGTPAGSIQRLIDTPMGRTLLSLDEDGAIERLVRRFNAERREHEAAVNVGELIEEIRSIREAGHYYSTNSIHAGFAIAATNVQAANGQWQVIGIGHRCEVVGPDNGRLLHALRCAADGVVGRMEEDSRPVSSPMPFVGAGPRAGEPMLAARA